jgi:hypothetical protein
MDKLTERWGTTEEISAARPRFETAIPGWVAPMAYGIGRLCDSGGGLAGDLNQPRDDRHVEASRKHAVAGRADSSDEMAGPPRMAGRLGAGNVVCRAGRNRPGRQEQEAVGPLR